MLAPGIAVTKKINIICLLAAIAIILVLPLRKEIWYDETVSMLCAKGISHDTPAFFAASDTISSVAIEQLNTVPNVFAATVNDNANSFLYNIGLHWFTLLCGNSIIAYTLFSKLIGIATLIAFYFLCLLFFENSLLISLAIILLVCDVNFTGMSHEIRAYALGMLFVTLAGIHFFRFMYSAERPVYLFYTGLFSVAAILSHFLSVYIILVFLGALVFTKKTVLLKPGNLLAIFVPVALIALFFCFAYPGLQTMSQQNHAIQQKTMASGFSVKEVLVRALKFTAINLKVVFPALWNKLPVIVLSFLLVISLYVAGIKAAISKAQKHNLHILFLLSAGGSLFLALLCVKSHHYTALYYRYFSFCLPFCSVFVAYTLWVLMSNNHIKKTVIACLAMFLVIPPVVLFATATIKTRPAQKYSHAAAAREIIASGSAKIEVREWQDALLINTMLPRGFKIDYFRNAAATDFTIYKAEHPIKIPIVRIDQ